LWLATSSTRVVSWTAPGVIAWVAIFAAFAIVGAVSAALSTRRAD
jgi:hypothetical protein